jgi:hypothetical protein
MRPMRPKARADEEVLKLVMIKCTGGRSLKGVRQVMNISMNRIPRLDKPVLRTALGKTSCSQ